ncbi:hypothetical protein [Clostridium sporogenes]|uniref:hypothetical protein n=1 Tax=Clostridium sporogenes TaxID=1509 RepID=UPI002238E8AE|nr:hypothetical protein [Clostridium sporogenes]EKS4343210.1 hypothetical protein [Clostridium botulinum]EKS4396098.1 hypothetical protein [Clostridium botulinum]MCW6078239.1 hypothetical protein [Clostridium sporogenes]
MAKCKVEFYKKNGYQAFENGDANKITLEHCLVSVKINRNLTTPTAEATITAQYENLPTAIFAGGTQGIIDNFAQVKIYIEDVLQFTGVIKKYDYNTLDKTIEMTCHDMYYRMLNLCDKELKFYNKTAADIISTVVSDAKCSFQRSGGNNYTVSKLECEIGTMYNDIIGNLVETMYARIRANKNGAIILEEQYPAYNESNHEANHHDYVLSVDTNLSSETASRDSSLMRNILKICCNDKYSIFESKAMTSYLNGERWVDIIDNPLASTPLLKQKVAGYKFLDMWRESTSLNVVPVAGIPNIDLGQVVKLVNNQRGNGWYLIVGISTEINADTYLDTLQLQGMRDKTKVYDQCIQIGSGRLKQ